MIDTIVSDQYLGHSYVIRVFPDHDGEDGWGGEYAEVNRDGRVHYWTTVPQLGTVFGRPPRSATDAIRLVKLEIVSMHQVLARLFPHDYE
jgi:hypothetical protein